MNQAKEIIHQCLKYLDPKSVLDLGCGEGKFTLRFAKKGINVLGVDKDKKDIQEANFNFLQKDIKDFKFEQEYDLIFSSMVLHFLKKDHALEIIKKIKTNTLDKGFNFLICMSDKEDSAKRNPIYFYPNTKELNNLYSDWEIIKNELCLSKKHKHNNGEVHQHKIIIFLAKKKN